MTLGKELKKLQYEKELIELLSPEKFKRTRYEFFIIKFMSDYYLDCGKIKSSLRVFDKINEIRKSFTVKEDSKDYELLLAQLASVKPLTDQFFDNVVVNDENQDIKNNRLELLSMFCKVFNNFIDFSKLEGA